jgi:AraC family transcriptional regulator
MTETDRVLFETAWVKVGAFRCAPSHERFRDSGPIENYCFVFPRTIVTITHADAPAFVADPTIATLYNKEQIYRRDAVSPEGDRCDWFGIAPDILREAVATHDRRAADDCRPVRFPYAPVDAPLYLRQRRLFVGIDRGQADALYTEEAILALLEDVLTAAYASRRTDHPGALRLSARASVEAAQQLIGRRFAEPLTLDAIGRAVGCSVYSLCRSFRAVTGRSIHAYRDQLRLRSALERLEGGERDLTRLALDLGYSSHSHFTANFRTVFGTLPSLARADLAPPDPSARPTCSP